MKKTGDADVFHVSAKIIDKVFFPAGSEPFHYLLYSNSMLAVYAHGNFFVYIGFVPISVAS